MTPSEDPWKGLVEAAKSSPEEEEARTPRLSVKNLRTTVHQIALTLTWRKWSLLAAIAAGLVFLVVFFLIRNDDPAEGPIIQPAPPTSLSAP